MKQFLSCTPTTWLPLTNCGRCFDGLQAELAQIIVGQDEVIERLAICLFARGHALLMGVPGLAKTLLVSSWPRRCR